MSNDERPEFQALEQLEAVLTRVTEELAAWRRRALKAEAEQASAGGDRASAEAQDQLAALVARNAELERRLEATRKRVSELTGRLRFLGEQAALEEQHQ